MFEASELFFLPDYWWLDSQLLWLGVLLIAAIVAGEVCERWLSLPRIIGFVAAGVALGPQAAGLVSPDTLFEFRQLFHLTVGLMLFELGQRVDFGWLKRNPWLLATSLLEAGLSFVAVFAMLTVFDVRPLVAAIAAAIAMATSPAVLLALSNDLKAQGQVTDRLLLLSALNTVYAIVALTMLFSWAHLEYQENWTVIILHPVYLIGGSLALAVALAVLARWLMRHLSDRADAQFACMVALLVVAVVLAGSLKLPVVLCLLALGVLTRMLDRGHRFSTLSLGRTGTLVVAILFTLTGASLEFQQLQTGTAIALALIAVRCAGKSLAVFSLARPSALTFRKASLLSIGLAPMSGIALVLMQDTLTLYPAFGADLTAVILSAIVILEVVGPLAARFALTQAHDAAEAV